MPDDDLAEMTTGTKRLLFEPMAQPALENRPGLDSRGNFRDLVQGRSPPQPNPLLSDADYARASLLTQQFAALIQNTNITVSAPAHNEPNLWSTPIDLSAQIIIPGAVGNYIAPIQYRAQPGRWVRISGYGVDVTDSTYTYNGSLIWRIRKNGVYVETLGDWGEHRGSVIRPRETFILLNGDNGQGDQISFEVRRAVLAAEATTVNMALVGWTWRPRNNFEGTRAGTTAY